MPHSVIRELRAPAQSHPATPLATIEPPPGWHLVRDCPLGGLNAVLPWALLHPRFGVALPGVPESLRREAVPRLRARLEAARFSAIFPGHLPILLLDTTATHGPALEEALRRAFARSWPLTLAGGDAWVAAVERALLADRPVPEPPTWRRQRRARRRPWRLAMTGLAMALVGLLLGAVLSQTILLTRDPAVRPATAPASGDRSAETSGQAEPAPPADAPVPGPQAPASASSRQPASPAPAPAAADAAAPPAIALPEAPAIRAPDTRAAVPPMERPRPDTVPALPAPAPQPLAPVAAPPDRDAAPSRARAPAASPPVAVNGARPTPSETPLAPPSPGILRLPSGQSATLPETPADRAAPGRLVLPPAARGQPEPPALPPIAAPPETGSRTPRQPSERGLPGEEVPSAGPRGNAHAPPFASTAEPTGERQPAPRLPPIAGPPAAGSPGHATAPALMPPRAPGMGESLPSLPPTRSAAQEAAMLARCRQIFSGLRQGAPVNDEDLGFFDRWCQVQ